MIYKIYQAILKRKIFLLLLLFYFITRLVFLTRLPIFNDEAIYLDWGWREIHTQGMLYYSLYDGKAPLLMWLFGVSESIFVDPLFAGRLVSVLISLGTLAGIYLISRTLYNKKVAVLSSVIYIVVPIFAFFDRQALMEGPLAATSVLACYFAIKLWITGQKRYAFWVGVLLGLTFWIKASGLLFIIVYFLLSFILIWKDKQRKQTAQYMAIVLMMILAVNLFLIINPNFWSTFHLNTRAAIQTTQVVHSPLSMALKNGINNVIISFFYLTPLIFISSILGMYKIVKEKSGIQLLLIGWSLLSIIGETITVGNTVQRYIVAFLPLLVITSAYFFLFIHEKYRRIGWFILACSLLIPAMLTFSLIISPSTYIYIMAKTNNFSEIGYIEGQTSGYNMLELKNYFDKLSENNKIFVGIAQNAGNPESAMNVYFQKSNRITASYFDSSLFGSMLNGVDCLVIPEKVYFVSRDEQRVGLDRFLSKIKTFKNPYSRYTIGVYKLKENCKGKSLRINPEIK